MPIERDAPWRHNVIGVVTHAMATLVTRRADRIFVSTTAWNPTLRRLAPRSPEPISLPIPSNLADSVAPEEVRRVRARLGLGPDDVVIGTFGTYVQVGDLLAATLGPLLERDPRRVALLVGKGSTEFRERAFRGAARVLATGAIDLPDVAAHLAACNVLLQPYPDGITTRRTSAMAGLALGVPVITNEGHNVEPLWRDSGAVALASAPSAAAILPLAENVLTDATLRALLGARGRELHHRAFTMESVVKTLREATRSGAPG